MKKTKLALFVLSTMGLAAGLAGCNNDQSSSPSSSESSSSTCVVDETKRGTIKVSEEMPTEIGVGETVNLDDYITVTGVDCWVVEVTEGAEFVTMTDHVIVGLDCGHIKLLLKAGRTNKAVEMDVISEEKAAINELLAAITNNYTAELLEDGESIGYKALHNQNYWWACTGDETEGKALLHDGGWYTFNYDGNTAQSVTFPAGSADPSGPYYYISMDFPLKGEHFEDKKDKDGKVIYDDSGLTTVQLKNSVDLDDTEVYLIVKAMGIRFNPGYFDTCWAEITVDVAGKSSLVLHGQKKTTMRDGTVVLKDSGIDLKISAVNETHINGVDDYIESGRLPEAIEATELKSAVAALEATKLYKFESDFSVLDSQGYEIKEEDAAGYQIFTDATLADVWDYFHGHTTAFVNGQSYYSVDNSDGYVVSYVNHDGKMHRVTGEKDEAGVMHYEGTDYSAIFAGDTAYEDITLYTQQGDAVPVNLTVSKLTDEFIDSADFYSQSVDAKTGNLLYGVTGKGEDQGALMETMIRMAPQISTMADSMGLVDYKNPAVVAKQDAYIIIGTDGSVSIEMTQGYYTADQAKTFMFYASVTVTPTATDMVPTDYLDEVVWPTVTE